MWFTLVHTNAECPPTDTMHGEISKGETQQLLRFVLVDPGFFEPSEDSLEHRNMGKRVPI